VSRNLIQFVHLVREAKKGDNNMKYLPIIALTVAVSACAAQPVENYASIGKSAKPPAVLAQCIAASWADKSQQPVVSQTVIANNLGVDVLVPGQPPGGNAATVRPSLQGTGSWVGYRSAQGGAPDATVTSDINSCL